MGNWGPSANFEHTHINFKLCAEHLNKRNYGATLSEHERGHVEMLLCEAADLLEHWGLVTKTEDFSESVESFINSFDKEEDLYEDDKEEDNE